MFPEASFCQGVKLASENSKLLLTLKILQPVTNLSSVMDFGRRRLTGYFPDVHKPADEGGVGKKKLKHFTGADVEDFVQIDPTLHLGQTHTFLH